MVLQLNRVVIATTRAARAGDGCSRAGRGASVRLLDRRDDGMTLLLDRVLPGDTLDDAELGCEEKLALIGGLVARLHAGATGEQG